MENLLKCGFLCSMNLVIVESPTKAKTIQKFLGSDYVVKSSFGHIRDLQDKKLSIDVENGFAPEYVIPADKKKLVADLKIEAAKASIVWLASDEDREGEAISWHLADTLGLKKENTRRIVFHEITKGAILNAVKNPREIDMNLVNAQQARRVLDRLVGFELSPVLWRKIKRGLSAGRVQSVALRLVVDREREILAFQPEAFYKVDALFKGAGVKMKGTLDTRFNGLDQAEKFLEDSIGATFKVAEVEKKEGTRFPAPPFTTSTLQQEAARKLHFPVSLTMRVAQSLYERGLITYMRTDSTNLSALALGTTKDFIIENFGEQYSHTRQYKTKSKGAQEAHEAIRPTFVVNTEIEGTAQEQKLYSLIWKRTVASQMEEAKVLNTTLKVASDRRSEKFGIQASEILFDGFLKLYMEGTDDEEMDETVNSIPEIRIGDTLEALEITADCKYTQAPYRYSEQTLVKKLEELGIGRPSTYAPTISTLTTGRGYILNGDKEGRKVQVSNLVLKGSEISTVSKTETVGAEKGKLLPQDIGLIVTDFLVDNFPDIVDYDFTANVEKDFDKIAEGEMVWNKLISEFYSPFHGKVDGTMHDNSFSHVERELGVDPSDGLKLVAKFGQFGPYVQKGEGDSRQFASLASGQLIESITLEEAVKLFQLPRNLGEYKGADIIVMKGRFGPYIRFGESNITLPKGTDPLKVSLEQCREFVDNGLDKASKKKVLADFGAEDIQILDGAYGPYIKHDGRNFKIPKGVSPESLTLAACKNIIENSEPTSRRYHKFKKTK